MEWGGGQRGALTLLPGPGPRWGANQVAARAPFAPNRVAPRASVPRCSAKLTGSPLPQAHVPAMRMAPGVSLYFHRKCSWSPTEGPAIHAETWTGPGRGAAEP